MIRRQFIKNSALTFLGAALLNEKSLAHSLKKKERIGIQLYSIRAAMKENPLGTLEKLAAMGYTIVEHANYVNRKFYGYTPAEFKKILEDLVRQEMGSAYPLRAPLDVNIGFGKSWDLAAH